MKEIKVAGMKIGVPEYYQQVDSMPDDPADSVPLMCRTQDATCFLMIFPVDKSRTMPLDSSEVINGIHGALGENQGLVEVNSGSDYVYSIVKNVKEEGGVQYVLTLHKLFAKAALNVQGFFDETETTGIRDSAVYELLRKENKKAGSEDDPFAGWAGDPYDEEYKKGALMNVSEQEAFDEYFPESPLSLCRECIRNIIQ